MSFFRRLDAALNPASTAYPTTTGHASQTATATPESVPAGSAYLYRVLGFLADHPGVIDHDAPGLPTLNQTGEN